MKEQENNKRKHEEMEIEIVSMRQSHEKNIGSLKERIKNYKYTIQKKQEEATEAHIKLLRVRRNIDHLEMLQKFYSPSGFRPLVMEYYAPILSECANYFFKDFTSDKGKIVVDSKSNLASGKVVDKVDIQVHENNKKKPFPGAWSLGEGGCIDISLNLGIMRLASMKASKEFNILWLDEITNSLSSKWIDKLIKIIRSRVLANEMTILMTSHMPIPESNFDNVWTVRKEKKESRIFKTV